MEPVANTRVVPCKRPYDLGKRQELSGLTRAAILAAARSELESNGFLQLTMETLARKSGVSRQTIHNLFGTKGDVLEALFDQIATDAGLERMRDVMQRANAEAMLTGFVEVFTGFWTKHRMLLRRIHGIAAIDPEFGAAVGARNRRRQMAAARIVERLGKGAGKNEGEKATLKVATLYALTSFEFFDVLAESCGSMESASASVLLLAKKALAPSSST